MRQVNANAPEVLIRNVIRDSTSLPFFRYFKVRHPTTKGLLPQVVEVPSAEVPMAHTLTAHGTNADLIRIDSLRAVLISFQVTNGETGSLERTERISMKIPLPNMGLKQLKICGSEPVLGAALTVTFDNADGENKVLLSWPKAFDESLGEKDVVRYVLWRRQISPVNEKYGDPLTSIAAGLPTYAYTDKQSLESGATYEYRLAAQDCSPKLSAAVLGSTTASVP
jgi:hypothetical protein